MPTLYSITDGLMTLAIIFGALGAIVALLWILVKMEESIGPEAEAMWQKRQDKHNEEKARLEESMQK